MDERSHFILYCKIISTFKFGSYPLRSKRICNFFCRSRCVGRYASVLITNFARGHVAVHRLAFSRWSEFRFSTFRFRLRFCNEQIFEAADRFSRDFGRTKATWLRRSNEDLIRIGIAAGDHERPRFAAIIRLMGNATSAERSAGIYKS